MDFLSLKCCMIYMSSQVVGGVEYNCFSYPSFAPEAPLKYLEDFIRESRPGLS
jgi:hypothetical protein